MEGEKVHCFLVKSADGDRETKINVLFGTAAVEEQVKECFSARGRLRAFATRETAQEKGNDGVLLSQLCAALGPPGRISAAYLREGQFEVSDGVATIWVAGLEQEPGRRKSGSSCIASSADSKRVRASPTDMAALEAVYEFMWPRGSTGVALPRRSASGEGMGEAWKWLDRHMLRGLQSLGYSTQDASDLLGAKLTRCVSANLTPLSHLPANLPA